VIIAVLGESGGRSINIRRKIIEVVLKEGRAVVEAHAGTARGRDVHPAVAAQGVFVEFGEAHFFFGLWLLLQVSFPFFGDAVVEYGNLVAISLLLMSGMEGTFSGLTRPSAFLGLETQLHVYSS